jgi:hypothetical protein
VKILASNGLIGVLFAICISYSSCAGARDDNPDSHPGLAPLFANHAPLDVTIEAPLTTLMDERPEKEYLEGTFSYTTGERVPGRNVQLYQRRWHATDIRSEITYAR